MDECTRRYETIKIRGGFKDKRLEEDAVPSSPLLPLFSWPSKLTSTPLGTVILALSFKCSCKLLYFINQLQNISTKEFRKEKKNGQDG